MLNKVMIIGRLGADPDLRYTQTGSPVATLNVATDESYNDRDGNKVDRTEWHRIIIFQRQAENCAKFLHKGSLVYIEGKLQTRKWQDQQGQDRYTTEIVAQRVQFLDRRGDDSRQYGNDDNWGQNPGRGNQGRAPVRQRQSRDEDLGPAFPSEANMNASRGSNSGMGDVHSRQRQSRDDDLGPAFPSEANMNVSRGGDSSMDEVPF